MIKSLLTYTALIAVAVAGVKTVTENVQPIDTGRVQTIETSYQNMTNPTP